jgi:hypothetical protein
MLTLPIKGKYFKMIESGEKPEEYRNITPYYMSRFKNIFEMYPYTEYYILKIHEKRRIV